MSQPSSAARKRQIIFGVVSGAIAGIAVSAFTGFWWWLPTGIIVGIASGMLIAPPEEK